MSDLAQLHSSSDKDPALSMDSRALSHLASHQHNPTFARRTSGPWEDGRKEIQVEAGEEMGTTQQLGSPALEPLHSEATLSHNYLLAATRCSISSTVGKRSWSSHTVFLKGKQCDAIKPQEGAAEETPLRTWKVTRPAKEKLDLQPNFQLPICK